MAPRDVVQAQPSWKRQDSPTHCGHSRKTS
jgi:hypothetical protein